MSAPDPLHILLDIEGTTTPIDFVHRVLFDHARANLPRFLATHCADPEIGRELDALRELHSRDREAGLRPPPLETPLGRNDTSDLLDYCLWLMDHDRKLGPLKSLQGRIWHAGYLAGELEAELFDDVAPALWRWQRQQRQTSIYSSGSVLAQRLLFAHSQAGDLSKAIDGYFDTAVGSKAEPASYAAIAEALGCRAEQVLFISDVPAELDAARAVGMQTCLSERPGNAAVEPGHGHARIVSFDELFP